MKLLCAVEDFEKAKNTDFLPLECEKCKDTFLQRKSTIKRAMYYLAGMNKARKTLQFCSLHCSGTGSRKKRQKIIGKKCKECSKFFLTETRQSRFCSRSCQSKFGYRRKPPRPNNRSKAENYLFVKVAKSVPHLEVIPNDRKFLDSGLEIDIFIPELKLGIEVNGPHHYKPIHGVDNLKKVQERDRKKSQELDEKGIRLLSIDISGDEHRLWEVSRKLLDEVFREQVIPLLGPTVTPDLVRHTQEKTSSD